MSSWRVYYNRWAEAPLIWSIDKGAQDTEFNVKEIHLHRVNADTMVDPSVPSGDRERPRVWFQVDHAVLRVQDDIAHFYHDPEWRTPKIAGIAKCSISTQVKTLPAQQSPTTDMKALTTQDLRRR
jgi:hypothetical protein